MWNKEASSKRTAEQWKALAETQITVKKLTREMDLKNLSPTDVRVVHGAHLYLDITNFRDVVEHPTLRREHFKPLHRYLHVLRIELRRIAQALFDGDKIQVQGPKFHALLYKPYDDDGELAWHSVLMAATMSQVLRKSLPKVFEYYPELIPTVGIDLGDVVVANIGIRGDRELISIGSAANHPAKILGHENGITVTSNVWNNLTEKHQELFTKVGEVYRLGPSGIDEVELMLAEHGFEWTPQESIDCMADTVESLPLDEIESHEAEVCIELSQLGPRHFKVANAATVFCDMDGYTSLIDSLLGDELKLAEAVKLLHLFRYELQKVSEADFNGVAIQHQGDRLQAILHLPKDDEDRIRRKIIDLCISLNSSVEQVLNVECLVFQAYHVSIGAAYGKTVIVRSGVKGDLDASCFGDAVLDAEVMQIVSKGNEMRISSSIYSSITDDDLRERFSYDKANECYVASGLTWVSIEDKKNTKAYAAGAVPLFNVASKRLEFGDRGTSVERAGTIPVKNTRNWSI
jgi:class 3 adenylate cyclase